MENNEWIKQEPYVTDDGYYTPVNAYALSGGASMYRLTISREHFIECYKKWILNNPSSSLPSLDEYLEAQKAASSEKSDPLFKCPKCGGIVRKDLSYVLLTYPAKYRYECDACDYFTVM